MSFASMHNDYLDPDRAGLNDENWSTEYEGIIAALKKHDSGRWDWGKIDCCLTGKDADLEPYGQQGVGILSVNGAGVRFGVYGGKTLAGTDVCLNTPDDLDGDTYSAVLDLWLEQAQEIASGCGSDGYWDGDSWFMEFEDEASVNWVLNDKLEPDYDATAQAVIDKANEVLKPWEDEVILADRICSQLAGWLDGKNKHVPEGTVAEGSVYWIYLNYVKDQPK